MSYWWQRIRKKAMNTSVCINTHEAANDYCSGEITYRLAIPDDNSVINSILQQTPMDSWISLSTEHEPDYFYSSNLFGHKETIVARKTENAEVTVGMCSYTKMQVHINGAAVIAGYLGELRVLPEFRNRLHILRNGFKSVKIFSKQKGNIFHWYTSVAKENRVARRLLEANIKGMPKYHPQGEMLTFALPVKSGRIAANIQPAQLSDIPELVKFYNNQAKQYQYSPVLTEDWLKNVDGRYGLRLKDFYILKEGESIRACFALWDQRNIKQTVVRGYRFPLNILRQPYNIIARLSGGVTLPSIGEKINYIFIAFLAVDEEIKTEYKKIISTALSLITLRNADLAMIGLSTKNPLVDELASFPKQSYYTCIEGVTWPADVATQDVSKTSGTRIVQPEIAIL